MDIEKYKLTLRDEMAQYLWRNHPDYKLGKPLLKEMHRSIIEKFSKQAEQILAKVLPLIEQAKQEGRKEVVDFMKAHGCGLESCAMEYQILQAQLKEWGISEDSDK